MMEDLDTSKIDLTKQQFTEFIGSKPSRQAIKRFLLERAELFLATKGPRAPRYQRRKLAKILAKRFAQKVLGEST